VHFLSGWIHDLIVVVALAAVVEMLLPNGDFRRFAVLVMGLLVVLALSKPLLGYVQGAVISGGGTLRVVPGPAAGDYSFSSEEAAFSSTDAALREGLSAHLGSLVAVSLGIQPADVRIEVGLEGRAGWPRLLRYLRVRVMRAPEQLVEAWISAQGAGDAPASGSGGAAPAPVPVPVRTRADALAAIGQALRVQLESIYRLESGAVEVIMPR